MDKVIPKFVRARLLLDQNTGYPELSLNVVQTLAVPSNNSYEINPAQDEIYSCMGILIHVKQDYYLDPLDHESLSVKFDSIKRKSAIPVPRLSAKVVEVTSIIPSEYTELLEYFSRTICMKEVKSSIQSVRVWLSLFTIYPDFSGYYKKYLRNPDANIKVDTSGCKEDRNFSLMVIETTNYDIDAKIATNEALDQVILSLTPQFTEHEVKASILFIYLCLFKLFDNENHFQEFKTKRLNNLNFLMASSVKQLILPDAFYKEVRTILNLYPLLVKTLYFFLRESINTAETKATYNLVNYAGISMYKFISDFMLGTKKTLAHRDITILKEIALFSGHLKRLREKYGAHWSYVSFLEPGVPQDVRTKFPNLTMAAFLFQKLHIDKAIMDNFKLGTSHHTIPGLTQLVQTIDNSDIYDLETTLSIEGVDEDAIREGMKILKINEAKFTAALTRKQEKSYGGNESILLGLTKLIENLNAKND